MDIEKKIKYEFDFFDETYFTLERYKALMNFYLSAPGQVGFIPCSDEPLHYSHLINYIVQLTKDKPKPKQSLSLIMYEVNLYLEASYSGSCIQEAIKWTES